MNIFFKVLTLTGAFYSLLFIYLIPSHVSLAVPLFTYYSVTFAVPFLTIFNLNLLMQSQLSGVGLKISCLAFTFHMISFMIYFLCLDFNLLQKIFL